MSAEEPASAAADTDKAFCASIRLSLSVVRDE